jgi:voltage-gated potassium channel
VDTSVRLRTRNEADDRRLDRYERRMALPIFLSAILPIVFALAGRESIVSNTVLIVAWIVFVVDLVVHIRLIPRYLRSGPGVFDVVVVVLTAPWFLIPGLGDARFLAVARLARVARIAKAGRGELRKLIIQLGRVGLVVVALIFTCAYVAYSAERSVNDLFGSFGDSLWWATVTITTVGYGDIYPITTVGRLTAVVLMFSGLGVLGILAGSLATFFGFGNSQAADQSEPVEEQGRSAEAAVEPTTDAAVLQARLVELRARIAELDTAVVALQRSGDPSSGQ